MEEVVSASVGTTAMGRPRSSPVRRSTAAKNASSMSMNRFSHRHGRACRLVMDIYTIDYVPKTAPDQA